MLTEVRIENFKAFSRLSLPLRPLTILTGLNNAGKSSVIQALLLAEIARSGDAYVPLNGPFGLNLGEASDVLNLEAPRSSIRIELVGVDWADRFELHVPDERSVSLHQRARQRAGRSAAIVGTYLSAERLGPRDLLEVDPNTHVAIGDEAHQILQSERLTVGDQGQYTPHVLAQYDRRQVREPMRHAGGEPGQAVPITLGSQTELWLSEIAQQVHVQARWLSGTNAATVRFRGADSRTEWMRPANVGFGLSYALPVVVASLLADPKHVLVIENPEAHLHPAGQSAMGRFLARVAASGVQTIVETHSDHVVNGVRREVAETRRPRAEDVVLHFFSRGGNSRIDVQESGSLTNWPKGFFDQTEVDLGALARAKRQ